MSIKLLSPTLANQIAAGEVVERPASVIKELIENSIDAKATEIKIELKKGGAQCIRVQDNGCGIAKEELPLALMRHATSKIESFEDLVEIQSLGFRGEALASVSSISRLTLSSKPKTQSEAWSVYVEGRDQAVHFKPISHPNGTSVEVLDLFYNTPARKRFLKSEKTELIHICDMVKKIALAYPHIQFSIDHNGKRLHHYPKQIGNETQKWLSALCGADFAQKSTWFSSAESLETKAPANLHLKGWIAKSNAQIHYFYINGRAIKDKVITHAIKQAMFDSGQFETISDVSLNYLLYLTIEPSEVDVNVHPTKQEVRFHQPQQIHHFIYERIYAQLMQRSATQSAQTAFLEQKTHDLKHSALQFKTPETTQTIEAPPQIEPQNQIAQKEKKSFFAPQMREPISADYRAGYQTLLEASQAQKRQAPIHQREMGPKTDQISSSTDLGRVCAVFNDQFALIEKKDDRARFFLLSIPRLNQLCFQLEFQSETKKERLLLPIRLRLTDEERQKTLQNKSLLQSIGFEFHFENERTLALNAVPKALRTEIWQQRFPQLLARFESAKPTKAQIIKVLWDFYQAAKVAESVLLSAVIQKMTQIEQLDRTALNEIIQDQTLMQPIEITSLLEQFK